MDEYPYHNPPPQHPFVSYEKPYEPPLPPNTSGYMEETVRRTATKGINHSRTPEPNLFNRPTLFHKASFAIGVVGLIVGAAALVLSLMSKSSTEAQIGQLRDQLASTQASVRADVANGSNNLNNLAGKVSNMGQAVDSLEQYNGACSMDFTGPSGPAVYWLPCTDQKP
jgi:hypothetical protein